MINEFVKQFTNKALGNIIKVKTEFYLINNNLKNFKDTLNLEPKQAGLFLGEIRNKKFVPSPSLLTELAKISDKKVFVNDKAEWMFLCKRNIIPNSILKPKLYKGLVLVQNKHDENLGYGLVQKDKTIKNLLDQGAYLRIEK